MMLRARPKESRGYVLLAVLWLIAALSLMVGTLLQEVRQETRQAMLDKSKLSAGALSEAAIRLVLCSMVGDASALSKGIVRKTVTIFDAAVGLEIVPMNGYIDLNNAQPALLADMLRYAGGMPADAATELAQKIVSYREIRDTQGQARKFHGVEDLLRVEGVDYALYARVEKLLTTHVNGPGLVNPLAASEEVLAILTKGDVTRAHQLAVARLASPESVDTSTLTASQIENTSTTYFEIRALGPVVDQVAYGVIWQVDLRTPAHGLPWQTIFMKPFSMRVGPQSS